jgi:hypothetical protein
VNVEQRVKCCGPRQIHVIRVSKYSKTVFAPHPLTELYMYTSLMCRSFNDSYPLIRYLGSNMIMNSEEWSTSWHCPGTSARTANSLVFDQKVDDLLLT